MSIPSNPREWNEQQYKIALRIREHAMREYMAVSRMIQEYERWNRDPELIQLEALTAFTQLGLAKVEQETM